MVFLEQGDVGGGEEWHVSGANRQICTDNSAHRHLWPHNKISGSSEEHGRKEYLKDPIRNPPCPTGKEKIHKCTVGCVKSFTASWIVLTLW